MGDSIFRIEVAYRSGNFLSTADSAAAENGRAGCRGMFINHRESAFRDVLDGLANTIMAGELVTDLGDNDVRTNGARQLNNTGNPPIVNPLACVDSNLLDPARPQFWVAGTNTLGGFNSNLGRGYQWANGEHYYTGVTTIRPPNSEVCYAQDFPGQEGIVTVSSRHQGGAHVLMGDGAVKFITDSIEAGNQRNQMVGFGFTGNSAPGSMSPYGLWGSLGTRGAKEVIEEEL